MSSQIETREESQFQKLRGGYYTPTEISRFLSRWAIQDQSNTVFEPSCGDGSLLVAAAQRLMDLGATPEEVSEQIHAAELHEAEAELARERLKQMRVYCNGSIYVGDFFSYDNQEWGVINRKFDVVVGNPPFLRYHAFPEDQRVRAFRIMQTASLRPSRLTNSWVAFLVASTLRLKEGGRLAMVIPAELLQVQYAKEVRGFLAKHYGAITIVTFRRLVFEGIQQEVVLLLAEKSPKFESGIDVVELEDASDLPGYEVQLRRRRHLKPMDHATEKWTQYYLDKKELDLLKAIKARGEVTRLGKLASVDVGVVTGNNNFFVLNEELANKTKLLTCTLPLVGRTVQIPGLVYTGDDWIKDRTSGVACHLLNLPELPIQQLSKEARKYIKQGELLDVHKGYKCGIRKLWYIVPSRWVPDAFLFRQIHRYPKMVFNCTGATSTDTIHRVRFHESRQADQIISCFFNSMTFAFSEVMGRSYGGGVLELEPTEAEALPIPFFEETKFDIAQLDEMERSNRTQEILNLVDKELLERRLGLSHSDVMMLRKIWNKLSERRVGRKKRVVREGE